MKIINNKEIMRENGNVESLISEKDTGREEEITTELVNTNEGFDRLENEWNYLTHLADSHLFQSYEWQRCWWKYFGHNHRLHIIVFRKQGDLVGIAPFYVEKTPLMFKFSYWRLRFIGSTVPTASSVGTFIDYSPTDYLDLIVSPGYEDQIVDIFFLYLEKAGDHFNQVDFDEVSDDSFIVRKIVPRLEQVKWSYKKERRETCPKINLPGSMEEYLFELPGKVRYELRYAMRAVTEKGLYNIEDAHSIDQVREIFNDFVELHQTRWNRQGMPGIFADPNFKNFLSEVTEAFHDKGWLKLKKACAGNRTLAIDYAVVFNNRVYDYQKALDDTSPLSKYGPGKTLFYDLMCEAIEGGCEVFDLLRGDEKYKMRIANDTCQNWLITIPNPDFKKGIKYRWYGAYTEMKVMISRVRREWLILKIHYREGELFAWISKYFKLLSARIRRKH